MVQWSVENSSEVQWFSGSVVQRFRALGENSSEVQWFSGSVVQRFIGSVVQ
jgi:hypothetical protein